jgi:hypothetical protein
MHRVEEFSEEGHLCTKVMKRQSEGSVKSKTSNMCQVPGCGKDLDKVSGRYCSRCRSASSVLMDNTSTSTEGARKRNNENSSRKQRCRFCRYCHRMHLLSEFSGGSTVCTEKQMQRSKGQSNSQEVARARRRYLNGGGDHQTRGSENASLLCLDDGEDEYGFAILQVRQNIHGAQSWFTFHGAILRKNKSSYKTSLLFSLKMIG